MKRVLIIGAGLAGLAAAKTLSSSGYEPLVLEAKDQAGAVLKQIIA
jgi:uncharacterized protein with NAD-binding domain and iron-sulfur cluster